MKKFISVLIAVLMIMQIFAFSVSAAPAPSRVYWTGERAGEIAFTMVSGVDEYAINLYKNNELIVDTTHSFGNYNNPEGYHQFVYEILDAGSGTYRAEVGPDDGSGNFTSSGNYVYKRPSKTLGKANVRFDKAEKMFTWDAVPGAVTYDAVFKVSWDGGENYDISWGYSCESDCYFNFWDNWDEELEYLMEEIEWEAECNGYDMDDALIVMCVEAYPANFNDANPSYSDYITLDGISIPNNDSGSTDDSDGDETDVSGSVDRSSITDIKYKEAAKLVYDLGLMPNVYNNPTANVTKGEFAEIAVKMYGSEDVAMLMKDERPIFSDLQIGTDINGYANFLYNQGLISYDGTYTFGASTEMSFAQIIKIMVGMTGYDVLAKNYGGYPMGYMAAASSAGISKGVSASVDSAITKEQMARLVANAIETKLMEQTAWTTSGPVYTKTDKTLLIKRLGYIKILGTGWADAREISIKNNILFSKDYLTGIPSADVEIENCDYDAIALNGIRSMFYIKDSKNMCTLQYFGGQVIINNGAEETSDRNVTLSIKADGFTKFKIDDEEYAPITSTVQYRLPETDGSQYVYVTFANDDETRTQTVSDSIVLNNKHTVTYMVNGEVVDSFVVGCGKSIPVTSIRPSIYGYRFNGWEARPSYMPDNDLVINAMLEPIATVTGTVVVDGTPVSGASVYVAGSWYADTNENGEFSFEIERGYNTATVKYGDMSKAVLCMATEAELDLGEIALSQKSTEISIVDERVTSVSGIEKLFDEEDKEYIKTEGNVVTANVNIGSGWIDGNMIQKEDETGYNVETLVVISVSKIKRGTENSITNLTETNELLEFKFDIPDNGKGTSSYAILREHDGAVDVLTNVPNADGEYIVVNQDSVTVYAKKFSRYGLAVKEVVYADRTDDGIKVNINLNEQIISDSGLMIVKVYDKNDILMGIKLVPVTSTYSDELEFECEDAAGYKIMFWNGIDMMKPVYVTLEGKL